MTTLTEGHEVAASDSTPKFDRYVCQQKQSNMKRCAAIGITELSLLIVYR